MQDDARFPYPRPDRVVCRGSWLFGTACGRCSRCVEEAPKAIATLRDNVAKLRGELAAARRVVVPAEEMTDEMMTAGQQYLDLKSLKGSHYLPATFNWHDFWKTIVAAAPKSA